MSILYINELAPWERKSEYYMHLQLGKDIKSQTEIINKQTKEMISSQIASTNSIISSQERIYDELGNLSYGISGVEHGIYELKAAFEWGISEVVWQFEQNREVLKNILEVLMAPLDTQAKELRKRAEYAYSNAWYEDSLKDFLESEEKNRYDFAIHISIGMIYLFHIIDKEKALEYFEKAIRYAKPKSHYYTSLALLYKGLIMRDLGRIEEAEKCAVEAIELSPDFAEAHYQHAQYNAQLGCVQKSLISLEEAIRADKYYCLKAEKDNMFDPVKSEVYTLIERLKNELNEWTQVRHNQIKEIIHELDETIKNISYFEHPQEVIENFREGINIIDELIKRNSYYDAIDAQLKFNTFLKNVKKFSRHKELYLQAISEKCQSQIEKVPEKLKEDKEEIKRKTEKIYRPGFGCILWFFLVFGYSFFAVIITYISKLESNDPIIWIPGVILFIGGYFISLAILRLIAFFVFRKRNYSKFISEQREKISNINNHKNKLAAINLKLISIL